MNDLQLSVLQHLDSIQFLHPLKILKCPDDLFDHILQMERVGNLPVVIRKHPSEFETRYATAEDASTYLIDTRRSLDPKPLVYAAKEWFYWGRYETPSKIAFLGRHYGFSGFQNDQKLDAFAIDLGNEFDLSNAIARIHLQ